MPAAGGPARIVIAGGGISGLVTAASLLELQPAADVVVLEAADRAGGVLGSERADGFTFELGPNGFLDGAPQTLELSRRLGLGERLVQASASARKRFVVHRGRLVPLPASPLRLLATPLLSWRGKAALLAEPWRRARPAAAIAGAEESVAAFARRRLGPEAARAFLEPMVTGVYAGDPEAIGIEAAFPRLAALERDHGSLWRGFLASRRAGNRLGRLWSCREGLEELAAALAARLGPRLRLRTRMEAVERRGGQGFECRLEGGAVEPAGAVVLAVPAPAAAAIAAPLGSALGDALRAIPYAPIAVVCLGFRRADVAHPLDGFGFLAPRAAGRRILGAIFVSTIFPAHAPPGAVSLRVMAGGARDPGAVRLDPAELQALALDELRPLLGIRGDPIAGKVYRYAAGIPQYNCGHIERVGRVEAAARAHPGLFLTGNAYRGVGVNDCVADGQRIAVETMEFVSPPQRGAPSHAAHGAA